MSAAEASRLAHMAQQIADAFRTLPPEEGAAAVAAHINQFWPPMMRRELVGDVGPDARALDPLVMRALAQIRVPAE